MTSCRARRMSERRLESEDIDPSLYRVRRMAVPQLTSDREPLFAGCRCRPFRQAIKDGTLDTNTLDNIDNYG